MYLDIEFQILLTCNEGIDTLIEKFVIMHVCLEWE